MPRRLIFSIYLFNLNYIAYIKYDSEIIKELKNEWELFILLFLIHMYISLKQMYSNRYITLL